ncbi:MupG family TIM beta-alpha barrel fold protein [Mycoplasma elephantis]|uniref:MupG family TIM beta-alpha barrel fold protein n=1 Tax=Mycoplasma elephantis TaxID=114882 RepID=UPI00048627DE|nr:MupG family TIM beta-alpha barrel fold protein [Mycoplasma elephantis]
MPINYSIFLSNIDRYYDNLPNVKGKNIKIFTSFHIEEEMGKITRNDIFNLCKKIKQKGYKIISDVSIKNLEFFGNDFFEYLSKNKLVDWFRVDYGFDIKQLIEISKLVPLCVNATGITINDLEIYKRNNIKIIAMHNYYPRPETGLDIEFFNEINNNLRKYNVDILTFISTDLEKRGPIFQGLPTLENQRYLKPYVSYVLLNELCGITNIFVGDGIISKTQVELINEYDENKVIILPLINIKDEEIINKTFTIRHDSPKNLFRIAESRVFSRKGKDVAPFNNNKERKLGSITIDNINYGRYTGEIQITNDDFCADPKINLIANIQPDYIELLKVIKRDRKIKFVKEIK